jgi:hypothetical protein
VIHPIYPILTTSMLLEFPTLNNASIDQYQHLNGLKGQLFATLSVTTNH